MIQRKLNIAVYSKVDKFLASPPLYMKQSMTNEEHAKQELLKMKRYKPKVMVGDLRKENCEFTSDLVSLAHNTRLVKKSKETGDCQPSLSLQQLRLND